MKAISYLGKPIIWFDRFVNWTAGRCRWIWSSFGGETNETISHTLGLEEAEKLYKLHAVLGDLVFGIKDIPIDSEHIIGELSSDLCDFFQKWHALRAINWDKRNAKGLCQKYPGIKELVEKFLRLKGIRE